MNCYFNTIFFATLKNNKSLPFSQQPIDNSRGPTNLSDPHESASIPSITHIKKKPSKNVPLRCKKKLYNLCDDMMSLLA